MRATDPSLARMAGVKSSDAPGGPSGSPKIVRNATPTDVSGVVPSSSSAASSMSMKTISLKLSDALHAKLERLAKNCKRTKSDVVREALEQMLNGASSARSISALDLAGDLVGSCQGPGDLSANPKYLEGFGR